MNTDENPDETPQFPDGGVVRIPPVAAPSNSHLKEYWFVDRHDADVSGPSELYVRFRSTASKKTGQTKPEATYVYTSMDHLALRQIFEAMTIASSPGTVLHRELIAAGNAGSPV